MPSILNLKFESFIAFSNLGDTDSLTKTWKVWTKVAGYPEQGQRLENFTWWLWHLQNLMVDTDNAKSMREFKKLSKVMGTKLDKEKGRSIEELEAPSFRRTGSTDLLIARAHEKERSREAQQSARPNTIKRTQFTFSIDGPSEPASAQHVDKPDLKPSAAFRRTGPRTARQPQQQQPQEAVEQPLTQRSRKQSVSVPSAPAPVQVDEFAAPRFPSYLSSDIGSAALLYAVPTLANSNPPMIEPGIDELMDDTPPQDRKPTHSWVPMDHANPATDTPTPATTAAPVALTFATATTVTPPPPTPSAFAPQPPTSSAPTQLATTPASKSVLCVRTDCIGPTQTDDELEEEERAAKRRHISTASSTYDTANGSEPPSSATLSASYATAVSSLANESYKMPKVFGSPASNDKHGASNGNDNAQSSG
ncbi:unnamed protein product [Peniophora sp. CBMAI 1063]|nr:unnamed protein product [Peniophora sp. CBMAI 1063]